MNLRGIISVSGKPGLFKLIGQNKSGFILESLDAQKTKLVINMSTSKMSSLDDITVFSDDEDLKLKTVLKIFLKLRRFPIQNRQMVQRCGIFLEKLHLLTMRNACILLISKRSCPGTWP